VGQDEILKHYAAADVMVISSCMEGVPVVLMEAMAMGMVVVSTNVGGIPELVRDGASGFLIPPGSAEELAKGLVRAARSREKWAEMGEQARRTVVEEFEIRGTAERMHGLFGRYVPQCLAGEKRVEPLKTAAEPVRAG
jgi:glycosyltransferase involved in cell wall biosynthesis